MYEQSGDIEDRLIGLLSMLDSFSDVERNEVRHFIDVGEYGLALETAYFIALEESRAISQAASHVLWDLATEMGITSTIDTSKLA
jgi:hypothetical protein